MLVLLMLADARCTWSWVYTSIHNHIIRTPLALEFVVRTDDLVWLDCLVPSIGLPSVTSLTSLLPFVCYLVGRSLQAAACLAGAFAHSLIRL
jgi:hypothetical protein